MNAAAPFWAALLVLAALLGGCASPASQQAMVVAPSPSPAARQHPYSVSVAVQGGSGTGALDSSNIASADLKAALEASIRESRLFSEVVQGPGGAYELSVSVIQINKPVFGLNFTVEMEAGWSLQRASDKQVLLRKVIKSAGAASMGDALAGFTRLRLALEAAARDNIRQGLGDIAALNL